MLPARDVTKTVVSGLPDLLTPETASAGGISHWQNAIHLAHSLRGLGLHWLTSVSCSPLACVEDSLFKLPTRGFDRLLARL